MGLVYAVATIAGYGALWWIVGLRAAGHGSPLTDALGALTLGLLVLAAWRRMPEENPERRRERARRGNIIGIVTGVQAVLVLLALHVLRLADRTDLLAPLVALIVGLHFLAFARLFPAWMYDLTSALLLGLGALGFLLADDGVRLLAVSLGSAGILWATCVAVLVWPESRHRGV